MKKFISVCEELKFVANRQRVVFASVFSHKQRISTVFDFVRLRTSRFIVVGIVGSCVIFFKRLSVEE